MHAEGALVIASQPLAPHSVVFVRLKSFGLMGFAHVRHCTKRRPWSYAIGVMCPTGLMKEQAGPWQFHQVCQTDDGWSEQWEASMKPGRALREP